MPISRYATLPLLLLTPDHGAQSDFLLFDSSEAQSLVRLTDNPESETPIFQGSATEGSRSQRPEGLADSW